MLIDVYYVWPVDRQSNCPTVQLPDCAIGLGMERCTSGIAIQHSWQSNGVSCPTFIAFQLFVLACCFSLRCAFFIPRFVLIRPVGKECWPDWPDWVIGAIVTDQLERPTTPHEACPGVIVRFSALVDFVELQSGEFD